MSCFSGQLDFYLSRWNLVHSTISCCSSSIGLHQAFQNRSSARCSDYVNKVRRCERYCNINSITTKYGCSTLYKCLADVRKTPFQLKTIPMLLNIMNNTRQSSLINGHACGKVCDVKCRITLSFQSKFQVYGPQLGRDFVKVKIDSTTWFHLFRFYIHFIRQP